jgi:two-component system sensor kinase FixL
LDDRSLAGPRFASSNAGSRLVSLRFWATGAAFLAVYLALNLLTGWYEFQGLGITLWSPDNGLSLLLLIESAAFAPFVFAGELAVDVFVHQVQHSIWISIADEALLTCGYLALASALRDLFGFDPRRVRLGDTLTLLVVVPAGAIATSLAYCGVLYFVGSLPADRFYSAMRHFWVGDTVGMIVIVPAATAAFSFASAAKRHWSRENAITCAVFALGMYLGFAALVSASAAHQIPLFYLLFLPIIWVAMRVGYLGVALALLATQIALFLTASSLGYEPNKLDEFQMLMLVLSITGLLLGVIVSERARESMELREQQSEMARISAHASVGAMGMALAHEISQPLSTVATYLHAARRMLLSGASGEAAMAALTKAEAEAARARDVLERVRDFVSSGALQFELVDLVEVTHKMRDIWKEDASAHGVRVDIQGLRSIAPVRADRIAIEQVLNNLVANAVDAASAHPELDGAVMMRVEARDDWVVIAVEDNGPGVAAELANSLFDAFQTTKPRGMGLGLLLSRRIVQNHAGRLWWEPVATGGSRFVVELRIDGPDRDAA